MRVPLSTCFTFPGVFFHSTLTGVLSCDATDLIMRVSVGTPTPPTKQLLKKLREFLPQ